VDLDLTLDGPDASADELRSLQRWLADEDELRGLVQAREAPPAADRLGPVLEVLEVVAGPAAGVLTASLVAWLRTRVGDVKLVVTPRQGERIELQAENVRSLDAEGLSALTTQLAKVARKL
jgi:hypothetical protein